MNNLKQNKHKQIIDTGMEPQSLVDYFIDMGFYASQGKHKSKTNKHNIT